MKFQTKPRKNHNRQQRPAKPEQPRRDDEEIISISYSDMYTSSTVGEPAYDMEAVQETPEPQSSMVLFSTLHPEDTPTVTSFPTDVQSIIRHQRCTTEEFEVVFRQVGEDFTPKQKNQLRLFQLLTSPTQSSNSSHAPKSDEDEMETSCFGSPWELTVWSISAILVISVTVILCALLYNRRIGDDVPVTAVPFSASTIPPQWTADALNVTTTSP
jgi:hypothetical protein